MQNNGKQSKQKPLSALEAVIGYKFISHKILETAMTHSSFSNEYKTKIKPENNERLEFLGDSVLSFIVSCYIYRNYHDFQEGDLTRIRAAAVCENSLARLAAELDLGIYMNMGNGEIATQGRNRRSTLADAFEALLAAIYLDGGIEAAENFILPKLMEVINLNAETGKEDFKSKLQKIVQQNPEEILEYAMIEEVGPPHDRIFKFNVLLNSNILGYGEGRSKREAEQNAAREALKYFGDDE